MPNDDNLCRWANYQGASDYSGLSTRLLEDYVKDGLIASSLVRRPGRKRGVRLIDLRSLDEFIAKGIGQKTDMAALEGHPNRDELNAESQADD